MITIRPAQQMAESTAMTRAAEAGDSRSSSINRVGRIAQPAPASPVPVCAGPVQLYGTIPAGGCQNATDICQR